MIKELERLKKDKKAVIAAHLYQPLEIQQIADFVGDSFELAKRCYASEAETIVFCGVRFMGESAKILCPNKKVFVPALDAECKMASMITENDVMRLRTLHPDAKVVCYINSTAAVKAASDVCCTSSNALKIVRKLDAKKIIFVPDKNLGRYVASLCPEKEFVFFNGFCPVHNDLNVVELKKTIAEHPNAPVLVHPECTETVSKMADYLGSTSGIISYVAGSELDDFIICTETGVIERLEMLYPSKHFYPGASGLVCEDMKKVTVQKIIESLSNGMGEISVPESVSASAKASLLKMMELGK